MTYSTSYRRMLNKLGYYNYHNALINRSLNQKGGWDSHCDRCRTFILKALEYYKPEKVTVLGSGWLLDLPLVEMTEKTDRVCLIDIIHPPEVISQTRTIRNIELIMEDVTGGLIEEVWQKAERYSFLNKLKSLEDIIIPEYYPTGDPGMVISLNILTQLEFLLVDFLKKRSVIREEEFNQFRSEIQKKHIDFLKKHRSLIISDYAEVFTDKSGNITTIPTLMTDLPRGQFTDDWTWQFEQTNNYLYNSTSVMKVTALSI
jgi:hypothetical protein